MCGGSALKFTLLRTGLALVGMEIQSADNRDVRLWSRRNERVGHFSQLWV
jgi:hypothetical protein